MKAAHLCCGAGGTSSGFEAVGIKTVFAVDIQSIVIMIVHYDGKRLQGPVPQSSCSCTPGVRIPRTN